MTPEERREAIRRFGFREPIGVEDFPVVAPMLVGTVALPVVGLVHLVSGDAGERVGGGLFLAVGMAILFWAGQYFRRPTAPLDDTDFERELRWRAERREKRERREP